MRLFCYLYRDCALLPHFFRHYDRIGVTDYHFIVNEHGVTGFSQAVRDACRGHRVTLRLLDKPFISAEKDDELNDLKNAFARSGEWVMVVDLDEFVELAFSVTALTSVHAICGYNAVLGTFVDRVAADGRLPPVEETPALALQFPVGTALTKAILLGWTHKIVLMRADLTITNCCHQAIGSRWCGRFLASIHHYKWNAALLPRLEERIRIFRERGLGWWVESDRFVTYYAHHGRVDLEDPILHAFRPQLRSPHILHDVAGVLTMLMKEFAVGALQFGVERGARLLDWSLAVLTPSGSESAQVDSSASQGATRG